LWCDERLRIVDLPTVKYRRLRGDMIDTSKRKYYVSVSSNISIATDIVTRSNSLKIFNRRQRQKVFFL